MSAGRMLCPYCKAPLRSERRTGWGVLEVYECGYTVDDGPGKPCPNRDQRIERDQATQPPQGGQ